MALSEHDGTRFSQVVQDLEAEDPDLVRKLRRRAQRSGGNALIFAATCLGTVLCGLGLAALGVYATGRACEVSGFGVALGGPVLLSYWWSIRNRGWRTVLSWLSPRHDRRLGHHDR